MTAPAQRRPAILWGIVAAAGLAGLWLWSARVRHQPPMGAAAPIEAQDPPQHARRDYPSLPPEAPAPSPPAPPPEPATAIAPVQPPPTPQVITVGDDRPAASPQTSSAWAINYRDAVCACHTRSCVRDLQAGFIRQLGAMVQGDATDEDKYTTATRAAIRCYSALPEGS